MNSIRSLERALIYEIERQATALDAGDAIVQETRHWDEDAGSTASMRSKEEAFDYRYFPEPDIPALEPDPAWVEDIRASLPELPRARRDRYVEALGLKPEVARVLVADRGATALFEGAVALGAEPGPSANWVTQDVAALRNAAGDDGALTAQHVADVVRLIADGAVSNAGAKQALEASFSSGESVEAAIDRLGVRQVSDTGALGALADEVLAENPDVVQKFRDGKEGVIGFLVGQLMQKAAGAANPKVAQELLRERLQG
jgi:aspartyl-tRNA(Asn)/glutamyl-tRNA(Gln) amidotransferase subunit B